MRNYYYIDSENVSAANYCQNMHKLSAQDTVLLFYTKESKPIPVMFMPQVKKSVCTLELIMCCNGTRNALDFVLSTKLGEMCYRSPKSKHIVISKDKGYTPVIEYWKSKGIEISQEHSIVIVKRTEEKITMKTKEEENQCLCL